MFLKADPLSGPSQPIAVTRPWRKGVPPRRPASLFVRDAGTASPVTEVHLALEICIGHWHKYFAIDNESNTYVTHLLICILPGGSGGA